MRWTLLLLVGVVGCGGAKPLGLATTPEKSRQVIVTALDAWKNGQTRDDLKNLSPPVYFQDDDLYRGRKLVDYQLEGEPRVLGTGLSYVVRLTLQNGTAQPATRKVAFRVVTEPNIAITREDGKL
jgi:hypothetical protein